MSANKITIFLCSLILFSSCNHLLFEDARDTNSGKTEAEVPQSPPNHLTKENTLESNDNPEELQTDDVYVQIKIPSVSKIEKKVLPAEILDDENEKTDILHPRCIAVDFKGDYEGYGQGESWFPARIMICPVNEYPKILAKSDHLVKDFQERISSLKEVLLLKPHRFDKKFPIINYLDASPAFTINLNYVPFKGGEGFFVMTQYANEPTVVNNRELMYIFQGFTNDEKYYVLGTFPVKSKHLPDNVNPNDIITGGDEYDEYIIKVKKLLKDKSSFEPQLEQIEETVKSLEIK